MSLWANFTFCKWHRKYKTLRCGCHYEPTLRFVNDTANIKLCGADVIKNQLYVVNGTANIKLCGADVTKSQRNWDVIVTAESLLTTWSQFQRLWNSQFTFKWTTRPKSSMVNYLYIISKANEAHVITIWAAKNNILISILPGDLRKSIFS